MSSTHVLSSLSDRALKTYRTGAHRLVQPEETLARVSPFLSAMEITRVANVTGLDRIGIPVVMVYRPNSRGLVCAQGKGLTLAAAKVSGLMEAIETYHAERITLPLEFGSWDDLKRSHRLANVNELDHPIESPFHPKLGLFWVEGYDLLQQEAVWVPHEMVTRNYTIPAPAGSGCFVSTCNGLASGNHLLEAISHGICELVERDAATLMGLAGAEAHARTLVRLDTVDDPSCREVLGKYDRAGFAVGAWDMTSDVGIPSFVCRIREENPRRGGIAAGFGCHPSRSVALLRALNEAAQNRLIAISGSLDDSPVTAAEAPESPYQAKQEDSVAPADPWFNLENPQRNFRDVPTWESNSFEEDVQWELDRLRAVGMQRVVVVNLTKEEFGLPVVRVVIPGLECAILYAGKYAIGKRAQSLIERLS